MSLQDSFYLIAIITLVMWIIFLAVLIFLLYKLQKNIMQLKENIQTKTAQLLSLRTATGSPVLRSLGLLILPVIFGWARKFFKRKQPPVS